MRFKILLPSLLFGVLLLTSCSTPADKQTNSDLDNIREYASSYSELVNGRSAIFDSLGMLTYYNDATYQKAKSEAKISNSVRAEYFPSVNWEGSEFLVEESTASVTELYVSAVTDSFIQYLAIVRVSPVVNPSYNNAYQISYSVNSDEIVEVTKIY